MRRRPPWWPEGEPWPPRGGPPWRRHPRRFFFRMASLFGALFFLTVAGCTAAFWLGAGALGYLELPPGREGLWRGAGLLGLALGGGAFVLTVRGLRRLAAPVEDLIEAARRVESGDYAARAVERGPVGLGGLARSFNSMAARLERDAVQRRNLLADLTHELKTPLTVIRGTLEGIQDGLYPADPPRLGPVLEEVQQITRLIDDLQLLGLLEAGAMQLQREETDLGEVAHEVAASFRPQAEAAGIQIAVEADPAAPAAQVDPARIRAVLANLIANALRYTPRGGEIRLDAGVEADRGKAVLVVRDTGVGMTPEVLPRAFDRFAKSADSPGRGLGLAIARDLVRAHGGEITVESEPGKGTRFRIELPRE